MNSITSVNVKKCIIFCGLRSWTYRPHVDFELKKGGVLLLGTMWYMYFAPKCTQLKTGLSEPQMHAV